MSFAAACVALFCALYAAAGIYGAGGIAYRSVASFLADDTQATREQGYASDFCTNRVAWLASAASEPRDARGRAASYLSAKCPDYRAHIEAIRTGLRD